jgi:hypothetical protein
MVYLRRYLDLLHGKIDHKDNIHSFATCNIQLTSFKWREFYTYAEDATLQIACSCKVGGEIVELLWRVVGWKREQQSIFK